MKSLSSFKLFFQWRLISVLLLGISSGLPLALTMGTLSLWLAESGINKSTIGAFALVGLPYSIKFLWAPVIDHLSIPYLGKLFGKRRSWMLLTQVCLAASLYGIGQIDPMSNIGLLSGFAFLVSFFSASQDVVIDAFRIEILDEKAYAAGAAMIVLGYRLGLLISSAGALFLASVLPWETVYAIMALCVSIGMVTVLLSKEPVVLIKEQSGSLMQRIKHMTAGPLLDFIKKPQWSIILAFIVFFKLGDAFLGNMLNPFYLDMGFSKIEIASVTKVFGLIATILGGFAGGVLVFRKGMLPSLLICGILQLVSNAVFALLAIAGHNIPMLTFTIAFENFASGMGGAALVAYLSSLCSLNFTASQYALLSAIASFGRTFFSAGAGVLAESTTWVIFFLLSSLIAVPGIVTLLVLMRLSIKENKGFEPVETTS